MGTMAHKKAMLTIHTMKQQQQFYQHLMQYSIGSNHYDSYLLLYVQAERMDVGCHCTCTWNKENQK